MTFAQPVWFLALALLLLLPFLRKRGFLGFSDHRLLAKSPLWLRMFAKLPLVLAALALILTVVALARPQIAGDPMHRTIPGRDISSSSIFRFRWASPSKGSSRHMRIRLNWRSRFLSMRRAVRSKGCTSTSPMRSSDCNVSTPRRTRCFASSRTVGAIRPAIVSG